MDKTIPIVSISGVFQLQGNNINFYVKSWNVIKGRYMASIEICSYYDDLMETLFNDPVSLFTP